MILDRNNPYYLQYRIGCGGSHAMDPPRDGWTVRSHNGCRGPSHHGTRGASAMTQELSIVGIDRAKSVVAVMGLYEGVWHTRACEGVNPVGGMVLSLAATWWLCWRDALIRATSTAASKRSKLRGI